MRFARPEFLNFLFLLFPILILFIWGLISKFKVQNKWKTSKLKDVSRFSSQAGEILVYCAALLVLVLVVLALARPQISYKKRVIIETHLDIICLIDLSRSMNALDVYQGSKKTVRLELVKEELRNFTERHVGEDKNQVALIAFAFKAFYRCFFTYDLNELLFHIDYLDVKDFPPEGTNLGRAITTGLDMLDLIDDHPGVFERKKHKRVFILISDGEDFGENTSQAVIRARTRGIPIYTIGIGSKQGGPIIDEMDEQGNIVYFRDEEGRVMYSQLEEETLKAVAKSSRGMYIHSKSGRDLSESFNLFLEKEAKSQELKQDYYDVYKYLLGVAFLLCILLIVRFI